MSLSFELTPCVSTPCSSVGFWRSTCHQTRTTVTDNPQLWPGLNMRLHVLPGSRTSCFGPSRRWCIPTDPASPGMVANHLQRIVFGGYFLIFTCSSLPQDQDISPCCFTLLWTGKRNSKTLTYVIWCRNLGVSDSSWFHPQRQATFCF